MKHDVYPLKRLFITTVVFFRKTAKHKRDLLEGKSTINDCNFINFRNSLSLKTAISLKTGDALQHRHPRWSRSAHASFRDGNTPSSRAIGKGRVKRIPEFSAFLVAQWRINCYLKTDKDL
jgi:hypothetical protein